MTITIPDWILCGPFWLGLAVGVILSIAFVLYLMGVPFDLF